MLKSEDAKLLSETGADTKMGAMLRRYWLPALLSEELAYGEGSLRRVRLLSEDLVAYREPSGKVGLVREFCSHRGASLYFGKVEEGGIRCSYHGWKYNAAGACVDMPNEPAESSFKTKIRHPAYPCQEHGGMIWAYLGPPEKKAALPELEYMLVPEGHTFVSKRLLECNWSQAVEADIDSSHVPFLHGHVFDKAFSATATSWVLNDRAPKIDPISTPYGFVIGSSRKTGDGGRYWRINHWLAPWYTMIPAETGNNPLAGHAWIPIDDTRTWVYTFTWHPSRPLTDAETAAMRAGNANYAELLPATYMPRHNRRNDYCADEGFRPGDQPWQRITTIQEQDASMLENMGAGHLYDRTQEHLGTTDVAIIQVRRRLIAAARALHRGDGDLPGSDPSSYRVRQLSIVLPESTKSWLEDVKSNLEARPETFIASA